MNHELYYKKADGTYVPFNEWTVQEKLDFFSAVQPYSAGLNELPDNILLDTDSYKLSHWVQYPDKTTKMSSYLSSRGGKFQQVLFVGLQPILVRLARGFTMKMVEEARVFAELHGEPFNYEGWKAMYEKHGGKFPVRIKSVAEGTAVPTGNVLVVVESTDPDFFWVVSWLETMLLRAWYPITVATQSFNIKKMILSFLQQTADDPMAEINFKLHDFGSRGVSSEESSQIGGAAHLTVFQGSDTIGGVRYANHYYKSTMSGFSIPASEHSTMTMWGGREGEVDAMRNMIKQYGKKGKIYACVSDQYDIYHAMEKIWGETLRDDIIASGATLVVRPDSGNPVEVLSRLCVIAEEKFGIQINSKGYKVFNNIRFIWGDGINFDSIRSILVKMTELGYSTTNFAFGMGGALLQQVHRDTQKFAFKCSHAIVDGKRVEVFKDPITDAGKSSFRGEVDLVHRNGRLMTLTGSDNIGSVLKEVFVNGEIKVEFTLDDVRKRIEKFL